MSAPSGTVYAEVAANNFSMDENVCYDGIKQCSGNSKSSGIKQDNNTISLVQKTSYANKVFLSLFILVLALLLGTVCACITFALEISKLKSEVDACVIQMESASLRSHNALETKIQNLSKTINQQLSLTNSALEEQIQHLNVSDSTARQQLKHALETPGMYPFHPVASCASLAPSTPSGHYWVRASNDSTVQVYCDVTRSCGGVTGGWARVAEVDMTNSSQQCPQGLIERIDSTRRTCGISVASGCSSITFSSAALRYSRVCGKIRAYQVGSTDSFGGYRSSQLDINDQYVDGVSLTHGNLRQHIWTFASALDEVSNSDSNCLCVSTSSPSLPPTFVGMDYFCDTGSSGAVRADTFYGDDPLWDGAGCGHRSMCCSFNNPPWFYKQLSQSTTDDIEMRVCRSESSENIAIELAEVYVH